MALKATLIRRPTEVRTAGLGSAAAIAEAFTGPWWHAVLAGAIAWAPAAFTFVVSHGGIRGVLYDLWHGDK